MMTINKHSKWNNMHHRIRCSAANTARDAELVCIEAIKHTKAAHAQTGDPEQSFLRHRNVQALTYHYNTEERRNSSEFTVCLFYLLLNAWTANNSKKINESLEQNQLIQRQKRLLTLLSQSIGKSTTRFWRKVPHLQSLPWHCGFSSLLRLKCSPLQELVQFNFFRRAAWKKEQLQL